MSGLPEVLDVKPMPVVESMNVETNQLDPVIINQTFCRFVLEKKGILDVGSVVTLSVHPVAAGDGKAFLPIKTGIHSLVKKAVFKAGTKVISQVDDYGVYQTMKRAFKTNEEKELKDIIKIGSSDTIMPSPTGDGKYAMKACEYTAVGAAQPYDALSLKSDETACPVFSIRLSELFPMMRNIQLPLYLIDEHISIELTFRTQGATQTGIIANFEDGYAGDTSMSVGTGNVKFLADYLTYSSARMDATAQMVMSDSGLVMPYEDLILTTASIPSANPAPTGTAVVKQSISRDLGLSGKTVRSILIHDSVATGDALQGVYSSLGYHVPDEYNFRINDQRVYARDIVLESRKMDQLSQVFGSQINCGLGEYSFDPLTNSQSPEHPINNQVFSAATFLGSAMTSLAGKCHYEGVDLSKTPLNIAGAGTQVGQKPIECLKTVFRTANDNATRTLRFFAMVERMFSLKSGQVFVSA